MTRDQADLETVFDAAISAHEARNDEQARLLCQKILRSHPDHIEALNLLAVILQDIGHAEESVLILERAIEFDPDFPDAYANLARGFRFMGEEPRAVTAARRATELDPDLGEGWLQLGFALVTLERRTEAIVALRQAVARMPDVVDLHVHIGAASERLGDHKAAADAWREVLRLQPDRVDALINYGLALTETNQLDEALAAHRRAVERAPDDLIALAGLARILHRRCDAAELADVCRRILAIEPGRLDILELLGNAQVWLGQFEGIEATQAAVLKIQPKNSSFARQIGALIPRSMDETALALCREQLHDIGVPIADRVNAGYTLAKALDQVSDYDAAFDALQATNSLTHTAALVAGQGFKAADLRTYVDNVLAQYTPPLFTAFRALGNPSEVPVFIVGMPRSGTSLVEQIAASHPRVFGAGERTDIVDLVTRLNRDRGFVSPLEWNPAEFDQAASDHVAHLRVLGGDVDRVIDKLPDNIQMLGHIRVLFPHARIIMCRRDLRDVCFSCYTTRFGDPVPWSNDLEECAVRAVEIERLTEYWRSVLPGPVMEISYEALVRNLEAESRRLIAFLGLDWEPACLEFHKTKRPVITASAWQVRQPLYDSSVGRWRRYRAHLGPMLKVLEPYAPESTVDSAAAATEFTA